MGSSKEKMYTYIYFFKYQAREEEPRSHDPISIIMAALINEAKCLSQFCVCVFACFSLPLSYLSLSLSLFLSFFLSFFLSLSLSLALSINLSICLSPFLQVAQVYSLIAEPIDWAACLFGRSNICFVSFVSFFYYYYSISFSRSYAVPDSNNKAGRNGSPPNLTGFKAGRRAD